MRARRRRFFFHFEGDETAFQSLLFLAEQGIASDEILFFEIDEKAESGFERRMVGRKIVAVQRIAGFEPQRVARAESTRFCAGFENSIPDANSELIWEEKFETVFAGVAGAGDEKFGVSEVCERDGGDVVALGKRLVAENFCENFGRFRALNGESGIVIALVFKFHAGDFMMMNPAKILVDFRGVDDEQIFVVSEMINDQIVDHAAAFIQQKSVLAFANGDLFDVVGEEMVQPRFGLRATDEKFAHVRNIKDADCVANGVVLVHNRVVLDGHHPAAEFDHFSAEANVFVVERGFFWLGIVRHAARLANDLKFAISKCTWRVNGSMTWIDKLEKRLGRYAITHWIRIVIFLNALVYLFHAINPHITGLLDLSPVLVMHGQVWRLVTFLFIPAFGGFFPDWLVAIVYLWFLWFIGEGLEREMGAFRVNLFYLIGMIGSIIAAFFLGGAFSNVMLNSSLFYAFAWFFPDVVIYIFFILPVKIKWLAWISAVFLLFGFVANSWAYRAAVIVSLCNYLLFFGPDIYRKARHRQSVASRRERFERAASEDADETLHRCEVCGRTEASNPDLDFRVSKNGKEYCTEHLPA